MAAKAKDRKCSVPGCTRPYMAKGYCQKHYDQMRNYGYIKPEPDPKTIERCSVNGCNQPSVESEKYCSKHLMQLQNYNQIISEVGRQKKKLCKVSGCTNPAHARGYCNTHYGQLWRSGKISPELRPRRRNAEEGYLSERERQIIRLRYQKERETLERELKRARMIYQVVIGYEGRLRWRREIESLERELRKLNAAEDAEEKRYANLAPLEMSSEPLNEDDIEISVYDDDMDD
ncbi:MAG: hypothetical protein WC712_04835 [Candidatus Brocadiia bacterium]